MQRTEQDGVIMYSAETGSDVSQFISAGFLILIVPVLI
jgi:hypothetical protein